jgi:hypothetical protein
MLIKLKQLIMKNKLFLAFAASLFAGLLVFNLNLAQNQPPGDITLTGVEMVASAEEPIEITGPTISCHQDALPGRVNRCWKLYTNYHWRPINDWCYFTGYMLDGCFI